MTNPSGASTALPPSYPFPGWHGAAGNNAAPQGYHWVWAQEDAKWRLGGDGKACRYTVGPGHATCRRPAVATLDRSWSARRSNRWGYCEDHLFSRVIHDGAIWAGRLVQDEKPDSTAAKSTSSDVVSGRPPEDFRDQQVCAQCGKPCGGQGHMGRCP